MFSWLANAWRVPELRKRVLFTAGVLALYRTEAREFTDDNLAALCELAPYLAACVGNALTFFCTSCRACR